MRTILSPIYIVKQYERGIVELFGKYQRFVAPGLHFQLPILHLTRIRDIREHTMDIEPQSVITKDNVEIRVDGIIWVRPGLSTEEIQKTFYNIDDWKVAVLQLTKTNLRQEFGGLTLDESLVAREKISSNLQSVLDRMTKDWGLKVCKVEIRLIDPPNDIKTAMHKQKTAEQERRSMKLLATGRYEAAEQDKLASIQLAEGKREAEIKIAEGKAKAIELVNEAAEKYFKGNAKELKQLEMTEACLKNNSKIILSEKGISPTLLIGDLPLRKAE
ncbi:MAG: SPFH/Band 7/PHB domain protein [Candidatus Omnitrophica bacterium]|nr:SPFH/Band 7/PHB domain protein [Candidatus Omnitrophota bacterium]